MPEYGDEVADETFLRDDFERKIGRRKVAGIDGDAVAENINFASLRGGENRNFSVMKNPTGRAPSGINSAKTLSLGSISAKRSKESVMPK